MAAVLLGASAMVPIAACAAPGGRADDDAHGAVIEIEQGVVTTGTVTTRGVVATASALDDWGGDKQIDPAIVTAGTLRVRYCAQHFPAGSPALANLTTAVHAYSAVPGVAIDITSIAAAAGTATHPDLATFALPANAIYVDYSYDMKPTAFAGTGFESCDSSTPRRCTQAHLYVNGDSVVTDTDIFNAGAAPSVGVFMHELGHVFGMRHLNEDDDSVVLDNPANMGFDLTTIHGHKLASDDFRDTVIQAATLAFLIARYPDPASAGDLATDEIVVHRNMSIVDPDAEAHIEFNPSKSYAAWGTGGALIADNNETKLRWNPLADAGGGLIGGFEPCTAPGTLPRWFARMSDTSVNWVNTPFEAVFEVSTTATGGTWNTVAERTFDSHVVGQADLRQIDWERTFPISAADAGVVNGAGITAPTTRKLRFRADSTNVLAERNEQNNQWQLNLCLYPATDTTCQSKTVVCAQP
jgi:hypothetical protein